MYSFRLYTGLKVPIQEPLKGESIIYDVSTGTVRVISSNIMQDSRHQKVV